MTFSVFHVSDLHFKNDYPCLARIKLLRDDILSQIKNKKAYLVFSGDLVNAGDDDLYSILLDEFFVHLDSAFEGIYLVPGNHDVQWDVAEQAQCDQFVKDATQSYLYGPESKLKLLNPFDKINPLSNYLSFQSLISKHQEENYFGSFDTNPDFSIVGLNSAWLCCRRHNGQSDANKLKIDPAIVEYFSERIDQDGFSICVMHHPLDWITKNVRQQIENLVSSKFDLFMFGHVHNPTTTSGTFNGGQCLFMQAPAVKSDDSLGNNAYSIINIDGDTKKYEIVYRAYSEPRNEFILGEDIWAGGVRYPTPQDEQHWSRLNNGTRLGLLTRFNDKIDEVDFSDWFRKNFIAKSKVITDFIEPSVVKVEYSEGQKLDSAPKKLSEVLEVENKLQFVIGPQDCGLTSASFLAAKHISSNFDRFQSVPVYINLAETKINKASLIRQAAKTSPVEFSYSEMNTLIDAGGVTFIFDQIGLPESEKFNHLISTFEKHFASSRAIIFCAVDGGLSETSSQNELELCPLTNVIFEIQELCSDEISELILKHRPNARPHETENVLNNVVASFKRMDEPVFPSSVAVLLETLQQIPDFRPLNRARLLDRYVECLLGRLDLEDVREGTFNSSDKINFLSSVAGHFAINSLIRVTAQDWNQICADYAKGKLLELPDNLLEEFIQKGILIHQNGQVTFRADYLFTYFVAKEMNLNPSVFDHIALYDAFYANRRELVFYSELEGVDSSKLLDETYQRLSDLEEKIYETYFINEIDFDEEWQRMLSEGKETDDNRLYETVNKVLEETPTAKSLHNARDYDLSNVARGRGVTRRTTIRELECRWLVAIKTYCQLIKHSTNLIAKEKMKHLEKAMESSELFIKSIATKRFHVGAKPIYYHSGILYINPLAETDLDRSQREFKYMVPASFAEILGDLVTNPQLAPAYRQLLLDGSEIVRFLVRHLLLELPGRENQQAFLNDLKNSKEKVLKTCSLKRLRFKYLGYSISDASRNHFSGIIEEISKDSSLNTTLQSEKLKKSRMLVDMKKNLSGS